MTSATVNEYGGKLRGVNLGGWLVLEKWITPSLFAGLRATDETSYCAELGEVEATRRLHRHWDTFITRDDFAWLARAGVNAVRLPIGHWLFGKDYPYHRAYGEARYPFVEGGVAIVDRVFRWAEECGLRVLLDLHAAPGCQNGFDNGGILDVCEWHTKEEYIEHSLDVLEKLAQRYGSQPALHGIQVLNEPSWDIPTELLKRYTAEAYHRIRRHCPAERTTVVFHDGFRDFREYAGFLQAPEFRNVAIDIHRYQCFVRSDLDLDIFGHIRMSAGELREEAATIVRESGYRVYCGEWSLGLDMKVVSLWAEGPFNHALEAMDEFQMAAALRGFAAAQLLAFEQCDGWFFWTYRTETTPEWSYRDCVDQGIIPDLGRPEQMAGIRAMLARAK
ncbi:MAG: glycoside hydrolase family 5 protein [Desulfobulbus sp.]|jgi:glucan 1,3-beta-glucosidase|uniref:glycoside hydrolase family 5 protein n=1 Tax=Desulfobulbus sp. TaxID=895 RepID=UPI002840AB74|nr:glycoside hydrolase family 5 protein [Desulfobulbus sp.]MDR2550256.1 glycoside hydrolase family 5 protein [Desulfobulbus sp.]